MNQTVVIHQGRNKIRVRVDQTLNHTQRCLWCTRVQQAGNEHVTGTLVQEVGIGWRVNVLEKLTVGLGETLGVAESVDNAANIKRIEMVPMKADSVKKLQS